MPKPTKRFSVRPGWRLEVVPLTLGRARIIHTDGERVDVFWCMESAIEALLSLRGFFLNPDLLEPAQWNRTNYGCEPGMCRRRPDQDHEKEFEAP